MIRQVLLPGGGDHIIEENMCFGKSHSKALLLSHSEINMRELWE